MDTFKMQRTRRLFPSVYRAAAWFGTLNMYPDNVRSRHDKTVKLLSLCLLAAAYAGVAESTGPSATPTPASRHATSLESRPFAFPLDPSEADTEPFCADFEEYNERTGRPRTYHAARDFARPAGTPVYAMADGRVSFSGRMGGYGWLVIVDHPQANLYSLYGHLSPSRWRKRSGAVRKGELIAYLGDSTENGGTPRRPLVTHLHFGVRAGQRADYPSKGEWRWQAGWIGPVPSDLGWLHPAVVLAAEKIPDGGYRKPAMNVLVVWREELLLISVLLMGAAGAAAYAYKKRKPALLLAQGIFLGAIAGIFSIRGITMSLVLLAAGILLFALGVIDLVRAARRKVAEGNGK